MIWMVSTLHAVNTQICHKHWDEAAQSEVTICFPLEIKRLIASATVYARSHLFTGLFSSASLMLMVQPVVCCDCEIISVAGATETLDGISSLQVKRVWKQRGKRGAFWMGLYNYSFAVCFFLFFLSEAVITAHSHGSLLLSAGLISQSMNRNCQSDAALCGETRGDWLLLLHSDTHTHTHTFFLVVSNVFALQKTDFSLHIQFSEDSS